MWNFVSGTKLIELYPPDQRSTYKSVTDIIVTQATQNSRQTKIGQDQLINSLFLPNGTVWIAARRALKQLQRRAIFKKYAC
jgi:hypothetical protein